MNKALFQGLQKLHKLKTKTKTKQKPCHSISSTWLRPESNSEKATLSMFLNLLPNFYFD